MLTAIHSRTSVNTSTAHLSSHAGDCPPAPHPAAQAAVIVAPVAISE
jgi:hypothetical protein